MSDFDRHPYLKTPNCEPAQPVNSTPHRWAEVIKAWADGKTVQFRSTVIPEYGWQDYCAGQGGFGPWYSAETYEWRIKPESQTAWVALSRDGFTPAMKCFYKADAIAEFKRQHPNHSIDAVVQVTWTEGEGL